MTFSIVNHHSYFVNIDSHEAEDLDDSITSRNSGSPGIGAYSYNQGYNFLTSRDIRSGEDLFFDHGKTSLSPSNYFNT